MMAAKISADKLKKLFFDSLVNGRIPSYWFTPPVTTHFKQRPNPRNERNLEKIRSLQAAIEDLEKEEEEWKKAMSRVNMFHASSVNTEEKDKELEFGDNYLRELDEDLAARVKEALQPVNDMMIDNDIKDTLFKIKATCQSLEIINEFQSRASKAIDRFHISAARKLRAADNQHENMVKTDYFKTPEESRKELDDDTYKLASDVAANDLAEIRKLIEGMNALVNSQLQLQSVQNEQQPPTEKQNADPPSIDPITHESSVEPKDPVHKPNPEQSAPIEQNPANRPLFSHAAPELPPTGVITEVTHLTSSRTLFFQLAQDATIDPLIIWLRLSFQDPYISGMVLQYKGLDGLWKCLLNRDDSLRRVIKQTLKNNMMLQMRVPREEDLLSVR
ncbi:hypothetical protein G6F56_000403 [Rhizopus delemar]|nr:hypothetical protein G6F56_000403 [Rhizopus delemar]